MSGEARPATWPRLALAGASGALLLLAALHQRADARGREAVERFFTTYTLDVRRPELVETARVEAAADLAKQVAVRAATLDVAGRTPLAKLEPGLRELWLRSVRELPEEVAAARGLALQALAARPAWAFHALGLAELVLADEWREPEAERTAARWREAAKLGAAWAPNAPGVWAAWAAASLERWPVLGEAERHEAQPVLKAALREEWFQRVALGPAVAALGADGALSLLPETPGALAVARGVLSGAPGFGFEERVALEERWTRAERAARRAAVEEIEAWRERGRAERAVPLARDYLRLHPVEAFDDAEGRAQARAVLAAVGDGRPGGWRSDPRGALVSWFLAAPERIGEAGADLARATRGMQDLPDGTRALVALHAGDEAGWRTVVDRTDTGGSSEWTPFWTELARRNLAEGLVAEAAEALARVSRFDAGRCEVVLARRAVARSRGGVAALLEGGEGERPAAPGAALDVSVWPAKGAGAIPLCVDPETAETSVLAVSAVSPEAAFAWWGWNGGRQGTWRLEAGRETTLKVPLAGLGGARTFSLGPVLGGPVRPTRARVETGGGDAAGAPLPPS